MRLPNDDRTIIVGLFGLALSARLVALIVLHWLAVPSGGPFLGPDSTAYLERSQLLAANAFAVPEHPIAVFRDLGVAHYYVFAAAVRWLGVDLFGLQLLNCTLIAAVAPLTYSWCRRVAPASALWVGLVVALHPSLITLGALDLLKDPSVLFFSSLAIWALVRLVGADSARSTALFALVASVALIYLRLDRFYIAAYVEGASVVALLYVAMRARSLRWLPVVALMATLLVAEIVPVRLGWPASHTIMLQSIGWARTVPKIRDYSPGLFDNIDADDAPPLTDDIGSLGPLDGVFNRRSQARFVVASLPLGGQERPILPSDPRAAQPVAATRFLQTIGSLPRPLRIPFTASVNTFRRMYGPFVWIMPDRWNVRTILTNDYPMYPGMLLWYAFLPMIVIGLVRTGWQLVTGTIATGARGEFGLAIVWLYTCLFVGQYLITSLAYRHRETMIPFLFTFGLLGMPREWSRGWKVGYATYWAGLAATAAIHLSLRTWLGQ
jgi:hypothetical protein